MQVRKGKFTVTDELVMAAFREYDPREEQLIEARGRRSLRRLKKKAARESAQELKAEEAI
jgi:hypothetical protein